MANKKSNINHSKAVLQAGYIAIATNLLLALFKIIVGALSSSLAITSDAIHGLVDTLSGIIVVASEKLGASKKFINNHEKIEHIGAILIAIIIIAVGIHIIIESIEGIISPSEEISYSIPTILVLICSIIAKFLLGKYLKDTGTKVKSDTLIASSIETINDSAISGAVLISIIAHLLWQINIEPYISIFIAIIIIKLGLQLIFPKISTHYH